MLSKQCTERRRRCCVGQQGASPGWEHPLGMERPSQHSGENRAVPVSGTASVNSESRAELPRDKTSCHQLGCQSAQLFPVLESDISTAADQGCFFCFLSSFQRAGCERRTMPRQGAGLGSASVRLMERGWQGIVLTIHSWQSQIYLALSRHRKDLALPCVFIWWVQTLQKTLDDCEGRSGGKRTVFKRT